MKTFFKFVATAIAIWIALITYEYVRDGDVCRTIFGCFAIWLWFWSNNR